MSRFGLTIILGLALSAPAHSTFADEAKSESDASAPTRREKLEQAFSEKLSGSVLVGSFTVDGQPADKPPKPERYEIESVVKSNGNLWVFTARVKYGTTDVKIPMVLPVEWAGDTPIIIMDDLTIPGLGTFSGRVLFHGNRYVATWQHGKVGGHMFGRIERSSEKTKVAQ